MIRAKCMPAATSPGSAKRANARTHARLLRRARCGSVVGTAACQPRPLRIACLTTCSSTATSRTCTNPTTTTAPVCSSPRCVCSWSIISSCAGTTAAAEYAGRCCRCRDRLAELNALEQVRQLRASSIVRDREPPPLVHGQLRYLDVSTDDGLVLEQCATHWQLTARIVGDPMGKLHRRNGHGDTSLCSCLLKRIDDGRVEADGRRTNMGFYCVRRCECAAG